MLVVDEAGGLPLTAAIEQVAATQAAATHATLALEDVQPLPAGNPRGFATYLLVLGWIIGGYAGMTLLTQALGPRARGMRGTATLTAWTAAYALASGGLGVVLMDPLMGALTGHPWALLGAGTLIVFAAAMSTAALRSLFRITGIVVAIVAFVVLGNPTSGGSEPVQMLSGGFQFLAKILAQQRRCRPRPEDRVFRRQPARPPSRGPRPLRRHRHGTLLRRRATPFTVCAGRATQRGRPAPITVRAGRAAERPTCSRSHHEQGTSHPGHSGRTRAHRRPGVAPTAPRQGRPSSRPHSRSSIGVESVTTRRKQRGRTVRHPECSGPGVIPGLVALPMARRRQRRTKCDDITRTHAIDDNPEILRTLDGTLRRYEHDYLIISEASPEKALRSSPRPSGR